MLKEIRNGQILAAGEVICLDLAEGGHWYGHGFAHEQPYPLETGEIVNDAFAVNNIQCPVWMCSTGHVLLAETLEPLAVAINREGDGKLRITPSAPTILRVFSGAGLPSACREFWRYVQARRPVVADETLLGDCFFCTWTQYPRCITQDRILDMARTILEHGYPASVLTIDDRWESCFGELTFGDDFPDPADMVRQLHELGFKVLLWVTPFINREAATYQELESRGLLVRDRQGEGAAPLRWWGGTAGLIDLTNPEGRQWYQNRLLHLKNEVGVDGFKIDGGDAKYQPTAEHALWHEALGASGYIDHFLRLCEDIAPGLCESRTAWLSQNRNILWRLGGKDSHWGEDNGLKALVSLSLHLALCGYDGIMPDMVPGRVQTMVRDMPLPTDELMIRWTEVSAFMPLLQFSYFPWNYAEPTADTVRQYARVHQVLGPYLVEHARDPAAPLLRPLWFDDPDQQALYAIADQFKLGPDILVCPVLDPGVTERDVVIPESGWHDAWSGEAVPEGRTSAYSAPCPGMPVFVHERNLELLEKLRQALSCIVCDSVPTDITTATYQAGLDRDLNVTG